MLEEAHSISDDEIPNRSTIPQLQSGYTTDDGMYKSMYSRYEERDVECRPHRGGKGRRGRQDTSRSQSRLRASRLEEREKKSKLKGRERDHGRARTTYTHTRHTDNTDNFTTESLAPHTIQSRDETLRPHRPHETHTQLFDSSDLGLENTTRLDLGNPENEQLNNRYSYRTESRMEVNDVTAGRENEQLLFTDNPAYIPAERAGDVFPRTTVLGNTIDSSSQPFSSSFMNRLAKARQVSPSKFHPNPEQLNVVSNEPTFEQSNEFCPEIEQLNVMPNDSNFEFQQEIDSVFSWCVDQSCEIENDMCSLANDSALSLKSQVRHEQSIEQTLP